MICSHSSILLALGLAACGSSTSDTNPDARTGGSDAPTGDSDARTGTGGDANSQLGCTFDDSITYEILAETVQLRGEGNDSCLVISRVNECAADEICKAAPFRWTGLQLFDGVTSETITTEADLTWTSTHHNWEDSGEAMGATRRYLLKSYYTQNFTDEYALTVFDKNSNAIVGGPYAMVPYAP